MTAMKMIEEAAKAIFRARPIVTKNWDEIGEESREDFRCLAQAALAAFESHAEPVAVSEWRCFHCDEVFTDRNEAFDHFGPSYIGMGVELTACQLTRDEKGIAGLLRDAWNELRRYQAEDTNLIREVHGLGAEHYRKEREAEEKGYGRGLTDGRGITAHAAPEASALDLLSEVRDKGLIYWEPNTTRGHVAKADMLRRIDAALAGKADTEETK